MISLVREMDDYLIDVRKKQNFSRMHTSYSVDASKAVTFCCF